jgi:hypothetical protein
MDQGNRLNRIFTRGVRTAIVIACLLGSTASTGLFSQDFDPPYPRFGIFTFSGQTYACLDILKDFDVISIPINNDMARQYKAQNPNLILLANDTWFVSYRALGLLPEPWSYHDRFSTSTGR